MFSYRWSTCITQHIMTCVVHADVRNTPCGSTTVLALSFPPLLKGRKQVKETGSPVKLAGSILTLSLEAVWLIGL